MRPEILYPLFAPVATLKGVGPRIAQLIEKLCGPDVVDLLWHLPSGLIDRRYAPKINAARADIVATLTVTVDRHLVPANKRTPYRIEVSDDTGAMTLVFFHGREDYLRRTLPEGSQRVVSGRLENFGDRLQMVHPDHIASPADRSELEVVEPTYPLTAGLTPKGLRKSIGDAVSRAPDLPEWLDPEYRRRQQWPSWHSALHAAHQPQGDADLLPDSAPRRRLAYDELLANQLALALIRARQRAGRGRTLVGDGRLRDKVVDALPYQLTSAQARVIGEIAADLAASTRMLRLLQGDVGSGKTVVALLAMLIAVEAGCQAVLMAPTEILARQHFAGLKPLADTAGVSLELLTGRDKGKGREALLARLAAGEIDLLVGTHAVFQQDVAFRDLAVAVIDEQHRFGVHQRLSLAGKGAQPVDVLVMTATPIPRTLTLTAYGDMDVSRLDEKPPGRAPVDTRVIALSRLSEVIERVVGAANSGAKVYWVCPLVSESEESDLAAAEERYDVLHAVLKDRVGLVHGQMKAADKDRVMTEFAEGGTAVLVATTVIEVGVDVADATIMVVEHAERFGLAQLHQLRGRVGRGGRPGTCLLLYASPIGETARQRLQVMRETEDGFRIAETDLKLRGGGEVLGTRQSGIPDFHLADLACHGDLLETARDDAGLILTRDPTLESERGKALRTLLYLFRLDEGVRLLRSG